MFNLHFATTQEVNYYFRTLYPIQDRILSAVGNHFGNAFYLTGGTALSRFYFHHRLSEDLDLFTGTENIKTAIPRLIKIIEDLGYEVVVENSSVTFGRLFVLIGNKRKLKIDLVADFPLENPRKVSNFYVDTINNIAINKIIAFENRAELKDLVDLYFIVKNGINLENLLELADKKRIPVPYEELLTINSIGLTGSVILLEKLEVKDIENFLKELKEILEKNVKKKVKEAEEKIEEIIYDLLWDFPIEERKISPTTIPVLKRRIKKLSYPKKKVITEHLSNKQNMFNLTRG